MKVFFFSGVVMTRPLSCSLISDNSAKQTVLREHLPFQTSNPIIRIESSANGSDGFTLLIQACETIQCR